MHTHNPVALALVDPAQANHTVVTSGNWSDSSLIGGGGSDRYILSKNGFSTIKTFDIIEDMFQVRGVKQFNDFRFVQEGNDTEILYGDRAIALFLNVDASAFSEEIYG